MRPLTDQEIIILQKQGCRSQCWEQVYISAETYLETLHNVEFTGHIEIGATGSLEKSQTSLDAPSGIYNTRLVNCKIGDYCRITHVPAGIMNYTIHDHVHIENVHKLCVRGETAFGNGTRVNVINEAGGRGVPIFTELDAQIAYILAYFPEKTELCSAIQKIIADVVEKQTTTIGVINSYSTIQNCGTIQNTCIGRYVHVDGAARLVNGSVLGSQTRPTFIGSGVIAEDFIIQEGATVDSQAVIEKCFIGQSVSISKQFSAENSCFFANCDMMHGEACSIFAGPFTVSHHKSTLLIAGMFSFYNAGSGTNFSNHMYKLGPIHQGVMQRGCKNGSGSYVLWPAHIGAFTSVIGQHKTHPDTSDFPFSILLNKDSSILLPGQNLSSIGSIRDADKWLKRDKRNADNKRDRIHFGLLNAHTVQALNTGLNKLDELADSEQKLVLHNGVQLSKASMKKGISLYRQALSIFISRVLAKHLQLIDIQHKDHEHLHSKSRYECREWLDVAGMLTPITALDSLFEKIVKQEIDTLEKLQKSLNFLYKNYIQFELDFVDYLLQEKHHKPIEKFSKADIAVLLREGADALQQQLTRIKADAKKEFAPAMQTGYATDKQNEQLAFAAIHGSVSDNALIGTLEKEFKNEVNSLLELADRCEE